MARKRKSRKSASEKGPSAFFIVTLVAGLLFVLWMVVQAILTNPLDNVPVEKPTSETSQETTP